MKRTGLVFVLAMIIISSMMSVAYGSPKGKKRPIHGIDVSHHNGSIDWRTLKRNHKTDIQFVYIKATEGSTWVDEDYKRNVKQARNQGLRVGSYHFFSPSQSAESQFRNFKKVVKASQQDILPMVDFEHLGGKRNARKAVAELKKFMRMVKAHYGVYPMVYTNVSIYNDYLAGDFKRYHLFIAYYRSEPPRLKDGARYTIWQFSEKGSMKGISEKVDLNRFHPDFSINSILY